MSLTKYIVFLIPRCSGSNGWQKCFAFWTIRILARTLRNSFKNAIVHYGLQQTQSSKLPTRHIATNNPIIHTNIETNNQKIYVTTQASELLAMFTCEGKSALKSVFWDIMYFCKISIFVNNKSTMEVLSRNKLFFVNNIDKFNVSWFRNPGSFPTDLWACRTVRLKTYANSWFSDDLVEDAGQFTIFVCIFVNKNTNKCQHVIWITIIYV